MVIYFILKIEIVAKQPGYQILKNIITSMYVYKYLGIPFIFTPYRSAAVFECESNMRQMLFVYIETYHVYSLLI